MRLFFFKAEYYSSECICCIFLSIHKYFCCFHLLLAFLNTAAMNLPVRISLVDATSICFGYKLSGGVAGLYGNMIYNSLRNLHSVFYSDCFIHISSSSG